jgi:Flp pilus assembly protein TadD
LANAYLLKGDKKKAIELYRELAKHEQNNPLIYNNYLNVMLDLGAFDEAHAYLKKNQRREPDHLLYRLDYGFVYLKNGELNKAEKFFKDLINENKLNQHRIRMMAEYFSSRSLSEYGILALTESRAAHNNPYLFSIELAMLYRIQGNQQKMVEEYLTFGTQNSGNVAQVKNIMQAVLTKPEELERLEKILYEKVQEFPDVEIFSDLLIWVSLQQKNFYSAFIQARAYDKRYKRDGDKSIEVARIAMENEDYVNAAKIYRYIMREFPNSQNRFMAGLGLLRTREAYIKSIFPVNKDSVRSLLRDYAAFILQFPDNVNSLEASRNQALLFANYLGNQDSAALILTKLIQNPRASQFLKSKAKIDLGDIYLIKGETWESTLLYSQVEKNQKENSIGYEAKLKNAKLSYYKGDFNLAQEHLDILKEATTREIANDALDLSMRIKENLAFDTTGAALREYAAIELLLFQNKTDEAMGRINDLRGDTLSAGGSSLPSNHVILDDLYWLEAGIRIRQGDFEKAISLLRKIQKEFPEDILSDDALFTEAEIYERHLRDKNVAMEKYRQFLTAYPGSVYAAEARKRFRVLRGDFNEMEQPIAP